MVASMWSADGEGELVLGFSSFCFSALVSVSLHFFAGLPEEVGSVPVQAGCFLSLVPVLAELVEDAVEVDFVRVLDFFSFCFFIQLLR